MLIQHYWINLKLIKQAFLVLKEEIIRVDGSNPDSGSGWDVKYDKKNKGDITQITGAVVHNFFQQMKLIVLFPL